MKRAPRDAGFLDDFAMNHTGELFGFTAQDALAADTSLDTPRIDYPVRCPKTRIKCYRPSLATGSVIESRYCPVIGSRNYEGRQQAALSRIDGAGARVNESLKGPR